MGVIQPFVVCLHLYLTPDFIYRHAVLETVEHKDQFEQALAEVRLRVLLLLKLAHDFVHFEHFSFPLVLVEWLGEERGDRKLREHLESRTDHLVVHLLALLQGEAIVKSSHFSELENLNLN